MWANPSAPPPSNAIPIFGRGLGASCCAVRGDSGCTLDCGCDGCFCAGDGTPQTPATDPTNAKAVRRHHVKLNIGSLAFRPCGLPLLCLLPSGCWPHILTTILPLPMRSSQPSASASVTYSLRRVTPIPGAALAQISRITGMINGRRLVLFWIYRFRSVRIFSLITP